ncbi:MAG: hypothetical protein K8T91_11390 [Planctomycetes bacterium]|nr:hypothetical protein [Planctomycetota bacterium]
MELLVVIAVIVVLIALLLPAINASRASSRAAKCNSHISQIGKSLQRAGLDRVTAVPSQWTTALAPYLDDAGALLHCPDHYEQPTALSYGLNTRSYRMSGGDSQRILALDYKQGLANVVGPQGTDDWPATVAARHRGQLNVLYYDGSVQLRRPDAVDPRVCLIHDEAWRPTRDSNLLKAGCTADVSLAPPAGTTTGTTSSSGSTTTGSTTTGGTTTTGTTTGTTTTGTTTGTTSTTTGGSTTGSTPCTVGFGQLVDDAAATPVGTWTPFTGGGYNNNFRYIPGGSGSNSVTYQFTGLNPGQYQVAATWSASTSWALSTPYIVTGGPSPVTVPVNQQLAPAADWVIGGVNFQNLAAVTITGTTLTVKITDNGAGMHMADAVRITCTGGGLPPGTICQGLKGEYRGDSQSFTGFPASDYIVRIDPSFNYPFGSGCAANCGSNGLPSGEVPSPSGLPYPFPSNRNPSDTDGDGTAQCLFTVKWTGEIKADFSETYTFSAAADDAVSIYINGSLVTGPIAMTANQWVPIEIRYMNTMWANDYLRIQWSSPSMPLQYLAVPNLRAPCP